MKIAFFEEVLRFTPKGKKHYGPLTAGFLGDDVWREKSGDAFEIGELAKTRYTAIFALLVLLVVVTFFGKAFALQVVKGKDNLALSQGNSVQAVSLRAPRGLIYDRNGVLLAGNIPAFSVELNTEVCGREAAPQKAGPPCQSIAAEISKFVKINANFVSQQLSSKKAIVVLAQNLTKDEILGLEANLYKFPAVSVSISPVRDYVFKDAFAHLLGYVGLGDVSYPLVVGKAGVEQIYDTELAGISGTKVIQTDSLGANARIVSETQAVSGRNLTLFVDSRLQTKAYELLKAKVDLDENTTGGAIVAQDPKTGGILALVSYPAFDPQKLSGGNISVGELGELTSQKDFPFFNRTVAGQYPPASTFKMVVAAAVLAENLVNEYFPINDVGYIMAGGLTFKNWKTDGHGLVDLRRALQVSNDTYFYIVGGGYGGVPGLGIDRLYKWARAFGLGLKTGVDLPGEAAGFMPAGGAGWFLGNTYITAIGQGDVLATPLQVNNVTAYFANNKVMFRPRVVKSVDGVGDTAAEVLAQDIVSGDVAGVVREGLNMAVEAGGTAYPLFDFVARHKGVRLAGKTGTAEFGGADSKATHAWFTVFGPYGNDVEASIALTVFLEGGGGGADSAAPLAKELLDLWFNQ